MQATMCLIQPPHPLSFRRVWMILTQQSSFKDIKRSRKVSLRRKGHPWSIALTIFGWWSQLQLIREEESKSSMSFMISWNSLDRDRSTLVGLSRSTSRGLSSLREESLTSEYGSLWTKSRRSTCTIRAIWELRLTPMSSQTGTTMFTWQTIVSSSMEISMASMRMEIQSATMCFRNTSMKTFLTSSWASASILYHGWRI